MENGGLLEADRAVAISFAAYRLLDHRYLNSIGATETIPEFDGLMDRLCLDRDDTSLVGEEPAAVGNRIGAAIIDATQDDGANEAEGYDAIPEYLAVNEPLIVRQPGTMMSEPNRWQPLEIENMVSQNGILLDSGVQTFIGPHWGHVTPFALNPGGEDGLPIDPGPPPYLGHPESDAAFKQSAVQVVAYSGVLDPAVTELVDISPASVGNNALGTHTNPGHDLNPITDEPYEPVMVELGDYGRAIAEFWADGPNSETPPGHWNSVANAVSDSMESLRIGGTGETVDRLEWDVKLYLALNAANHDAAVAAWGSKGYYDYVRPISMIRWMGGLGQSTNPTGPAYHPDGLPLIDGVVAVVTDESSAGGRIHEHLSDHIGEVAVFAYQGGPTDPETETGGVGWIRAVEWVPYQSPTFVTPSFAGYVSGHSTFSRASAEVLTAITGSEYFPGGLGGWTVAESSLDFEVGPTTDVPLQWATYYDAADQAGISRLYGGIHVAADDFGGRIMGSEIGTTVWNRVQLFYGD